jgi:hypothetical protein
MTTPVSGQYLSKCINCQPLKLFIPKRLFRRPESEDNTCVWSVSKQMDQISASEVVFSEEIV